MKKGTMFVCQYHSHVDVITNSSSELFTAHSSSKEELEKLIEAVYPNYLNEYELLKSTEELTDGELYTYISYHYSNWSNIHQKHLNEVIPGFTEEEMYENKSCGKYSYVFLSEDFIINNREKIINAIDPEKRMFFLFSEDSNPNWEMQELLMTFMQRYHLG